MNHFFDLSETSWDDLRDPVINQSDTYVFLVPTADLEKAKDFFSFGQRIIEECKKPGAAKSDYRDDYNLIFVNIPESLLSVRKSFPVCIYMTNDFLVFIGDHCSKIKGFIISEDSGALNGSNPEQILYSFFERLTRDDSSALAEIEKEISALEEKLITSKKNDVVHPIFHMRHRLLNLKWYYEKLIDITEALLENQNGIVNQKDLRLFKTLNHRFDRLFHDVINLRDYVTQVREAYQAQVDNRLNTLMNYFTVITTVFLPLNLIVGWYGMNLQMPEFGWSFAYPLVIAISVVTVLVSIYLFRKKNWF